MEEVIYGPTVPLAHGVIYQVTLASGAIVTGPGGFADAHSGREHQDVVVSHRGRVLRPERHIDATEVVTPA